MRGVVTLTLFSLLLVGKFLVFAERPKITAIEVKGNKIVETSTILYQIKTEVGDIFDPEKLREDLKNIYNLGLFSDVQIDAENFEGGLKITFIVKEKPVIREIIIKGNRFVKTKDIRERLTIYSGMILNEVKVKENLENIEKLYQEKGFYLARASYKIRKLPKNKVDIIYNIIEGRKIVVKKIKIVGNKHLSEKAIKKRMKTKDISSLYNWIMSFFTNYGTLQKDVLKADLDRILEFYYDKGFVHAHVGEPDIRFNRTLTEAYITIPVEEGPQYKFGKINVKGNKIYSDKEIMDLISIKPGEIYSRKKLRENVMKISDLYSKKGYIYADILPLTKIHEDKKTVDVTFEITEGIPVYVGKIEITGNTYTRDKVIRRELKLYEGDLFNASKLKEAYRNLMATGYFESVKIKTKETNKKNVLDINIEVEERNTGSFAFGAGYSSMEKLVGMVSLSQGNLFGRGQKIRFSMDFGTERQTYDIGFLEPWFLDTPLAVGFDIYHRIRERDTFDWSNSGWDLKFGYPLDEIFEKSKFFENMRASLMYKLERIKVYNLAGDASSEIKEEAGEKISSSVTFALSKSTINDKYDPTEGMLGRLSIEYAGLFGGEDRFLKTYLDYNKYIPMRWNTSLRLHGEIGYAVNMKGDRLPIYERFFVGGIDTVRGYDERSVGPKDVRGEYLGGDKMIVFNIEWKFPIYNPLHLKGIVFFDAGNAYGVDEGFNPIDLKKSIGFGIRIMTPFGPLRLDWGYPLDKEKGQPSSKWHFAVGTMF